MGITGHLNKYTKSILLLIVLITVTSTTFAKELADIKTSVSVSTGYTDNVDLEAFNKTGSFFAQVNPNIHFERQGSRVKANLDYTLQGVANSNVSDKKTYSINNRLFANVLTEIVASSIYLNLDGTITQELLDSTKSASDDNIVGSDNLTDTYTYAINPYWEKKWENWANSKFSYNFNEVIYDSDDDEPGNNSIGQNIQLDINSGNVFNTISWAINLNYDHINYDSEPNTSSSSSLGTLGYKYSNQLSFKAYVGYEEYDEKSDNNNGSNFGAGLVWNPSRQTSLEFSAGHRYYGDAYDLSFKHQMKRLGINFSYSENITNTRNQIRNNNQSIQSTAFAIEEDQGAIEQNSPQVSVPVNDSTSSLYLSRRFSGMTVAARLEVSFLVWPLTS